MSFVKQVGSGDYYLFKRKYKSRGRITNIKEMQQIFLVRQSYNCKAGNIFSINDIILPKELIGKKVMFRLEVIN